MKLNVVALPTMIAARWRGGEPEAYGLAPERAAASEGNGTPCRHCLAQVPRGHHCLIVAHRPFDALNPYTETGPILVRADECTRADGETLPRAMLTAPGYIVRGYSSAERSIHGSGGVIETHRIAARCAELLQQPEAGRPATTAISSRSSGDKGKVPGFCCQAPGGPALRG